MDIIDHEFLEARRAIEARITEILDAARVKEFERLASYTTSTARSSRGSTTSSRWPARTSRRTTTTSERSSASSTR
jgi:hypothetical protein